MYDLLWVFNICMKVIDHPLFNGSVALRRRIRKNRHLTVSHITKIYIGMKRPNLDDP